MAEAAARAAGLGRPLWILALRQTAGRGRRGRAWADPPGNFAATLVWKPAASPAEAGLRSFVAALALHDALAEATGQPGRFTLKWPNDVLLDGGKIAGILLESAGAGARVSHLAIGFGVNLVAAPPAGAVEPGAVAPVALAPATGVRIGPEEFLDLLAPAFAAAEARFCAHGFAPIRAAWLARAARIGQRVTARTAAGAVTGRFVDVDADGALVLETAEGLSRIAAADVFF